MDRTPEQEAALKSLVGRLRDVGEEAASRAEKARERDHRDMLRWGAEMWRSLAASVAQEGYDQVSFAKRARGIDWMMREAGSAAMPPQAEDLIRRATAALPPGKGSSLSGD